jgi:CheY-like chemotaxis protein
MAHDGASPERNSDLIETGGPSSLGGMPPLAPLRILVVDDRWDAGNPASALSTVGHDVEMVATASEALPRIGNFVPDLILLDLPVPEAEGIEFARSLRRMPLPRDPVLAALSPATDPRVRLRCAEAGFDHYLVKPACPATLGKLVELVRPALQRTSAFEPAAERYDALANAFLQSQLEFCGLALDTLRLFRDTDARQRQLLRVHKVVTMATVWLARQRSLTQSQREQVQSQIGLLRERMDLFRG